MVVRKRLRLECGGLAYVTTTATDWVPVFRYDAAARAVLGQLAETVLHYESTIAAYVLMPTHLHAIINLCRVRDLSLLVQAFKSLSARRVKALGMGKFDAVLYRSGKFHLWKSRIDDFIIRTPEQFFIKLNYIHENPVRAG
jgi:putative transposase